MLANLLLLLILLVVYLVLSLFDAQGRAGYAIYLAFFVPAIVCTYFLTAQRLRDMNLSGWLSLLWMPLGYIDQQFNGMISVCVLIILCSVPGSRGANRYGPDPLENGD